MSKCDSDSSPINRTHGVRDPEKTPGPGDHLSSNIENKGGITVSPIFINCTFGHDVSSTINATANIVNGVIEPASPSTCPQVGMNRGGQRATKRSCAPCSDMTTAPQKREKENTDDTITGYIHRVSPIMTSAKCHRYFTATFQSREGFHRTVIFDVDRYARFQHASTNQTPVELERITKEHSFNDPSSFKIICNRETILKDTSIDFPVKTVDDFSKFTIDKIKTMPSKQPIPSIDAHVSALQPATSQVTKWGGDHEVKECCISDSTSSIRLTLWNKAITAVELQKSYRFSNLTTRRFLGKTFLTITPRTKITPIDTLKNIHPMPTEGTCNENVLAIEAEVTAVSITQRHICNLCHKNQATFDTKSLKNKCTECKMHQHTCNYNTSTTAVINCKAGTGTHKLSLYTTAMNTYLQNNNLQHLVNDTGELENHFLDRRNFTFTVAQNVIAHMQAASLGETPKPYTHTPPLHM